MSFLKKIKIIVDKLLLKRRRYKSYIFHSKQFKSYLKNQNYRNVKIKGEELYLRKWRKLCRRVEPYSYRFFSHYCGYTPNIIPEDIGHSYIDYFLNPVEYRSVYEDKNLFPEIVGINNVPQTILRRINGSEILDVNFQLLVLPLTDLLDGYNELILKPSVESGSGRGVIKFVRSINGTFQSDDNIILTKDFLYSYSTDFCLQTCVSQHVFMKKLCSTSVNTIRLLVYRSVLSEEAVVTSSIIRIGKEGAFVDNAHAGGVFVGVDVKSGKLGEYTVDQFGNKLNIWNGIDFSNNEYIIPNWADIISFAKYVGGRLHHHRLIALDIALLENGKPTLIEYNLTATSYWLFMYTNQEVFGEYTDEIIDYCKSRLINDK